MAKAHRHKVITICSGPLLFFTLFSSEPLTLCASAPLIRFEKTKPICQQAGAKSYIKGDYGDKPVRGAKENKANLFRIEYCVMRIAKGNLKKQSQFACFTAENAECAEIFDV